MAKLDLYSRAEHAARTIQARTSEQARIAVVLGSGLGGFAEEFEGAVHIDYQQIPGFVTSTAQGHAGSLVIGKVEGVPVLAMQGRVHYYEGYSLEEVTFPIRTFKLLGIETVILTNAAGGIDVQLSQGALMVISDHLNLMGLIRCEEPTTSVLARAFLTCQKSILASCRSGWWKRPATWESLSGAESMQHLRAQATRRRPRFTCCALLGQMQLA